MHCHEVSFAFASQCTGRMLNSGLKTEPLGGSNKFRFETEVNLIFFKTELNKQKFGREKQKSFFDQPSRDKGMSHNLSFAWKPQL